MPEFSRFPSGASIEPSIKKDGGADSHTHINLQKIVEALAKTKVFLSSSNGSDTVFKQAGNRELILKKLLEGDISPLRHLPWSREGKDNAVIAIDKAGMGDADSQDRCLG
jgi:hypothetical protein